jgi:peptidoglycan/xylan/chitin deacetylase (PgdA/CDA1 family)
MLKRPSQGDGPEMATGRWAAVSRRARATVARPALARFDKPVISVSFDDFPKSAVKHGAALLESVGGRGTYYAASAFAGQTTQYGVMFDAEDVARLRAAGHEIGCHTFGHADASRDTPDDVFADMVRNADALMAMGMEERLVSFAYPYGAVTSALKKQLPARFTSARAAEPGVAHGRIDLAQLPANALYGDDALKRCLKLLELAQRKQGWAIFYAHDVGVRPTAWGAATATLERVLIAAFAAGMEIAPVGHVAARLAVE